MIQIEENESLREQNSDMFSIKDSAKSWVSSISALIGPYEKLQTKLKLFLSHIGQWGRHKLQEFTFAKLVSLACLIILSGLSALYYNSWHRAKIQASFGEIKAAALFLEQHLSARGQSKDNISAQDFAAAIEQLYQQKWLVNKANFALLDRQNKPLYIIGPSQDWPLLQEFLQQQKANKGEFTDNDMALPRLNDNVSLAHFALQDAYIFIHNLSQSEAKRGDNHYRILISLKSEVIFGSSFARFFYIAFLALYGSLLPSLFLYLYLRKSSRQDNCLGQLREIYQRLSTALGGANCALWEWYIDSDAIYWSNAMYDMLGYQSSHNLLALSELKKIILHKDIDLNNLAEQIKAKEIVELDLTIPMRHAKGYAKWIRLRASFSGENGNKFVGLAFDASKERQFAEQSAVADLRVREALENISESFVLWDKDQRLIMCNDKYLEQMGLTKKQVRPGIARDLIEMKAIAPKSETPSKKDKDGNFTCEKLLQDGTWVKISHRKTRDGGYISIGSDITQLKENHQILEDKQHQLCLILQQVKKSHSATIQAAKEINALNKKLQKEKERAESANIAKSKFLANMSHELRTPLNAILGFSELMQAEDFGPIGHPTYKGFINDIYKSGEHLLSLINNILDMAKIEAGRLAIKKQPTALAPLIQEAVRLISPAANKKQITIKSAVAPNLQLQLDPQAMQQVLLNILSNAVKFTENNGIIDISTKKLSNHIVCKIKDNGIGIPSAALKRLGSPFEQAENHFSKKYEGSGLGLAISRSLIALHNGRLNIDSVEGKGTTISIFIPL